ncbi:MAG: dihydrofolate reductase family protein, partial [Bacteroidia bacterium]|nr:dihydrofolate reductase family protein [Bacteroidia bacterium]
RHWDNNDPSKWLVWGESEMPVLDESWNTWNNSNLKGLLESMKNKDVQSVIVEGGQKLLNSFLDAGLYDEIRVIKSKHVQMGSGIKAPQRPALNYEMKEFSKDTIFTGIK